MNKPSKKQLTDRNSYFERNLKNILTHISRDGAPDTLDAPRVASDLQDLLDNAPSLTPEVKVDVVVGEEPEAGVEVEVLVGEDEPATTEE